MYTMHHPSPPTDLHLNSKLVETENIIHSEENHQISIFLPKNCKYI